jgi:hypothetical protein
MQIISDVELIEPTENNKDLIAKIKQEQQEKLKDINYAIDLNTGEVKQNNHTALIIGNIYPTSIPKELHDKLYDFYLDNFNDYNSNIQKYKTKKYKTTKTLNKDIYTFNKMFDANYYNGFNLRVKDLLNDSIKSAYIENRARTYTQVQYNSIQEYSIKAFLECNVNDLVEDKTHTTLLNASDLTIVQQEMLKVYDKSNNEQNITNLYNYIYDIILDLITIDIQQEVQDNLYFYKKIHKLYQDTNKDIIDIVNRFNTIAINITDATNKIEIQQPNVKKIPLLVPTIFNNTYINSKYTTIYDTAQLTLQIMLNLDIKTSDFRENIIFYDNLTKKRIDLLPIDYAIFIACTELNATNKSLSGIRGNIPITIDSIVQYIADNDKLYNTKKRQKALYNYIKDRLLLYKSCIIDAIYSTNGKIEKLYKDPIPILYNTQYNDPLNNDADSYIIGASAILTIIAQIETIEGKQYLASYTKAREYINDSQSNTIEILNIKYYILPKILQQLNAKSKGEVYNPKISLQDMYRSLALLKGKDTLSRQEEKRARDTTLKFLQHLKTKNILQDFDTKPLLKDTTDKPITKPNQKNRLHIY